MIELDRFFWKPARLKRKQTEEREQSDKTEKQEQTDEEKLLEENY